MDDDPGNSAPAEPDAWMRWRFVDDRAAAGQPGSNNHARYQFSRFAAPAVAQAVLAGKHSGVFVPVGPVSLRTVMFADDRDETLVVVVGEHEPVNEVEKALPYALEHVGDRDLVLVVPAGTEWPHLARLPWLDQHTRVFTHQANDPATIREHPIPLRSEVLDKTRAPTTMGTHVLSPTQLGWADELLSWANAHPRLLAGHRPGHLAWLVDGRLVLRIQRVASGKLRVSAGVQPGTSSLISGGLDVVLDGPLLDPEPYRAVIRSSIAERLAGGDTGNLEHRFQARLQQLGPADRMGLVTFIAEYPAMRPRPQGQAPGSIDFLGFDDTGRLHVVEAKVGGSDSMVFLQALDYWIWVEANRTELAEHLHADPERTAALSVVILPATDGSVLHRHNRTVADRLNRSVPLRVLVAGADLDAKLSLRPLPFGQIRAGSRFADRLRLRTRAAAAMTPGSQVAETHGSEPVTGVFGGSREAAAKLSAQGGLHRYVHVPHSSQRFALDLFGSLGTGGAARLLTRHFGAMTHVEEPMFEWTDDEDLLGESTPSRPWRTQVDVFLEGKTRDGRTVVLLVEVKLTEAAFGGCSHAEVAPPPNRAVCSQSGPFGGDVDQCWQLRNRDAGPRRCYDEVLPIADVGPDVGAGCWFRERNQPMRLAALAAALVAAARYDECVAVLTAPSGHVSLRRRWSESAGMFEPGLLGWLDPEAVLAVLGLEAQAFLIDRYGLGAPDATLHDPSSIEVRGWELMAELLCCHEHLALIETHPVDGLYDCLTLLDPAESEDNGPQIYLNRNGSLHALNTPIPVESMQDVWERLAAGGLDAAVAWCERALAIAHPSSAVRGWPRAFPRIARAHQGLAGWRNGIGDSYSGDGVMTKWFEQLPFLESVNRQRGGDLFDNSASRFWFLVNEADEALAAIELPRAKGWTRDGTIYYLDRGGAAEAFFTALT